MAWVKAPDGLMRWDGQPFPELHADAANQPRRFAGYGVAVSYASQRATRTGIRQHVQAVMTARGAVWEVSPVS